MSNSELSPLFNAFIRSSLTKGESANFSDIFAAAVALHTADDGRRADDVDPKALARLFQYGYLPPSIFSVLVQASPVDGKKEFRSLVRAFQYLAQLMLGDGSAGTPLPLPPDSDYPLGEVRLTKVVDTFGPEVLRRSWAGLSSERASHMMRRAAMRMLAAAAHADLTSKRDDSAYMGELYSTINAVLDKIASTRQGAGGLVSFINARSKKGSLAEVRGRMEMWGMHCVALSAARVALARSETGLSKIAPKCFSGVVSPNAVGARHALALAAGVATEPSGASLFISQIGPLLHNNVEMARSNGGVLFMGWQGSSFNPGAPPTITREQPENFLNLRDVWARVYLARGCAAAIHSAQIGGDVHGRGEVFWDALVMLACFDPSDLVALEAIRAIAGAPPPVASSLEARLQTSSDVDQSQIRIFASAWRMLLVGAFSHPPVHGAEEATTIFSPQPSLQESPIAAPGSNDRIRSKPDDDGSIFSIMVRRIIQCIEQSSRATLSAACKTVALLAESRCWYHSMAKSENIMTSEPAVRYMRSLRTYMQIVVVEDSLSSAVRCAAARALAWLQLVESPPIVTAGQIIKCAMQGGQTQPQIVSATFADPWPEALVSSYLRTLVRRMRATPALAGYLLRLAAAVAAACPSSTPIDLVVNLWDLASGKAGISAALEQLSAPLPPITQPATDAPIEVRAMACREEVSFERLRQAAAWWAGEHANAATGVAAWKSNSSKKASVVHIAPGMSDEEKLSLAGVALSPLMALIISHLHRAMLTGSWELRVVAAQALAKIAVRSNEPFRIQCYALLTSPLRAPGSKPSAKDKDPLGVAPIMAPAVEVLDAMYAGELVLEKLLEQHGEAAESWPAPVMDSLRERHEWLLATIQSRICTVPRDVFFPLGQASKKLLHPDDQEVEEGVEEEEGAEYDDEAAEEVSEDGTTSVQESRAVVTDPLARYQEEDGAHALPKTLWGGYDAEEASPRAARYEEDEDDMLYGTVLYDFRPDGDDEVAVSVGDRVLVKYDLGDWLHIVTAAGVTGLVPKDYVSLSHGAPQNLSSRPSMDTLRLRTASVSRSQTGISRTSLSEFPSMGGASGSGPAGDPHAGDPGTNRGGRFGSSTGTTPAWMASANAKQSTEWPAYDEYSQWNGGADVDDAANLAAISEIAQSVTMISMQVEGFQTQANLGRWDADQYERLREAITQQLSLLYYMEVVGANADRVRQDELERAYQVSDVLDALIAEREGDGASAAAAGTSIATQPSINLSPAMSFDAPSRTAPLREDTLGSARLGQLSFDGRMSETGRLRQLSSGGLTADVTGHVLYEFVGETENELSVAPGDQLLVRAEVDGWYQVTRASDNRSGLVPSSYVDVVEPS